MKLYNFEIGPFCSFLYKLKLIDVQSRMRTRFIRLLAEYQKRYEEEYLELVKEHARLDPEGNPRWIEEDGRKKYDIVDSESFRTAFERLALEEVSIDETEERRNMLVSVRDSVLRCQLAFEGDDQLAYDRWCEIVEGIA